MPEGSLGLEPPDLKYGVVAGVDEEEPVLLPARSLPSSASKQSPTRPERASTKGSKAGGKRKGEKRKKTKESVPLGARLEKWWLPIALLLFGGAGTYYIGNKYLLNRAIERAAEQGKVDIGFKAAIKTWADLNQTIAMFQEYRKPEEEQTGEPAANASADSGGGDSSQPQASPTNQQPNSPNAAQPEQTASRQTGGVSNVSPPPNQASEQQRAAPAEMPKLPKRQLNFAFLPPKPDLVVSVRVAELWNAPLVKDLLASFGPMAQQSIDQMASKFELAPDQIESIVVAVSGLAETISQGMALTQAAGAGDPGFDHPPPAGEGPSSKGEVVVVVRTRKAYDQEKILSAMPHGEPVQQDRASYYPLNDEGQVAGMTQPAFLYFANPQTLILGSEAAIQRAILRGRRSTPAPRTLQPLNANHHLVVAYLPQGKDLFGAVAGFAPGADYQGFLSALTQHASAFGISLHATDGLVAEVMVRCKNQAGAAEVAKAANEVIDQMRQSASAGDRSNPASLGAIALQILDSITTQQNGSTVTITAAVPPSVFEPQNLSMAMMPLMSSAGALVGGGPFAGEAIPDDDAVAGVLEAEHSAEQAAALPDEPIVPREPRTGPPRIVVDATQGGLSWWFPQSGPQFDPAEDHKGKGVVEYFQQRGWPVRELAVGDEVTETLQEADIAIRIGDTNPHTPEEVRAYDRFVRSGGTLLLVAGHRPTDRDDPLAEAFGIRFSGQISSGSIQQWDQQHPVTKRLGGVPFSFASEVTQWPESATILGRIGDRTDKGILFGVLDHGHGKVVFLSSESLLINLPQPMTDRVFALLSGELKVENARQRTNVLTAKRIDADFEPSGDLSQEAWASAKPIRIERETENGEVNSDLATTVRALWSEEYLYLGFEAPFTELTLFEGPNARGERRALTKKDAVEVLISGPSRHGDDYYEFQIAPNGEWADLEIKDSGEEGDFDWNSGFEKVAQIDQQENVWTAVMRIPLSKVHPEPPESGKRWRINLFRVDQANGVLLAWNPTRSEDIYVSRRFGSLLFED